MGKTQRQRSFGNDNDENRKHTLVERKMSPFVNPITKRKEQRKEKRRLKKSKRLAFSQGKEMPTISREETQKREAELAEKKRAKKRKRKTKEIQKKIEARKQRKQEIKDKKLEEQGQKLAIAKEEKELRELEKKLNMKKSRKSLPQSFVNDGLDYLFEALDTHWEEGAEDLDSGQGSGSEVEDEEIPSDDSEDESDGDMLDEIDDSDDDDSDDSDRNIRVVTSSSEPKPKSILKTKTLVKESESEGKIQKLKRKKHLESDSDENISDIELTKIKGPKIKEKQNLVKSKKVKFISGSDEDSNVNSDEGSDEMIVSDDDYNDIDNTNESFDGEDDDEDVDDDDEHVEDDVDDDINDDDEDDIDDDNNDSEKHSPDDNDDNSESVREDIYGRTLDKDGKVVKPEAGAYVPPARRSQLAGDSGKRKIMLDRLKKQLKGLINRASESNMQPISTQIEEMYMSNSRADVNELLTGLILDSSVSAILTPDRLCQELAMLVAILHGNVGMEVGAFFLQSLAKKFDSKFESCGHVGNESKEMANIIAVLANLYNFKIVQSTLLFDVAQRLVKRFREKDIEMILQLLKTAGFSLRKDDPEGLKDLILEVQTAAGSVDTSEFQDKSRVRFMLEVLLAIKNNNMRKIPNYDPEHLEHLRKLIRNYIRNGGLGSNQLNIGLEDLLTAEDRGRWWVVGSAWGGRDNNKHSQETSKPLQSVTAGVSRELMELARRQRMNTDIRKTIFYIIMTSEDYIDAFEKLLRLGLKHQQEREIIHVVLECCLQEKQYNPFYTFIALRFCQLDRRFQMTLQFSLWDKFKDMTKISQTNRENLASFLSHLLLKKGLSLSVLKVVEFGTLDKPMVRFLKSLLTSVLMATDQKEMEAVFERIAPLDKLQHLQEGLKLFMKHFLSNGHKSLEDIDRAEFTSRLKLADKALSLGQNSMLL